MRKSSDVAPFSEPDNPLLGTDATRWTIVLRGARLIVMIKRVVGTASRKDILSVPTTL